VALNRVAWSAIQIAIRRLSRKGCGCVLTYCVIRSARSSVPAAPRSCLTLHATLFSKEIALELFDGLARETDEIGSEPRDE
jgi:hypothetical protein